VTDDERRQMDAMWEQALRSRGIRPGSEHADAVLFDFAVDYFARLFVLGNDEQRRMVLACFAENGIEPVCEDGGIVEFRRAPQH
jgi:hypothetical protein